MTNVLVIAEHDGENLNPSTAKTVACATQISSDAVDLLVLGNNISGIAEAGSSLDGLRAVYTVESAGNGAALAAVWAPQIAAVAADYSHVLAPSTTFGKDLLPRVAALLDVNQISDLMEVIDATTFKRPIYAGNAIVTIDAGAASKVVATVRTASFKAVTNSGSAAVDAKSVDAEIPTHTRFKELAAEKSDRPDLQTAAKVVSGGRALASAENFEIIYKLADAMGAGVGASRAAVDAGYVPNDMQVGQTGKIIAPDLYVAIGISGAIQHLTGIKDAGTIVAINKDEEAPIFEVADIGLVGDLFQIVPELEAALS